MDECYKEVPGVENAERRLIFPMLTWLTKKKFEECVELMEIRPNLLTTNSNVNKNRIYIGKSISNSIEKLTHFYDRRTINNRNTESIGTVFKNDQSQWQLNVLDGTTLKQIKNDFHVLSIEDADSFCWHMTSNQFISKYALRGPIDEFSNECLYIGRTSPADLITNPPLFGKIQRSRGCLLVPLNGVETTFSKYDLLCLRPTPASLKTLSQIVVRSLTKYSNENVEQINKKNDVKHLPDSLIKFLKYPSYLTTGDYLFRNEKIVREDNLFEFLIETNGDLVCRSLIPNRNDLSKQQLDDCEAYQVKRLLASQTESVWLSRFYIIVFHNSKNNYRIKILAKSPNKSFNYKLFINENVPPSLSIESINS